MAVLFGVLEKKNVKAAKPNQFLLLWTNPSYCAERLGTWKKQNVLWNMIKDSRQQLHLFFRWSKEGDTYYQKMIFTAVKQGTKVRWQTRILLKNSTIISVCLILWTWFLTGPRTANFTLQRCGKRETTCEKHDLTSNFDSIHHGDKSSLYQQATGEQPKFPKWYLT